MSPETRKQAEARHVGHVRYLLHGNKQYIMGTVEVVYTEGCQIGNLTNYLYRQMSNFRGMLQNFSNNQ